MVGNWDGAMSLKADTAVSNVDTFSSASLQLPATWSNTGAIWEAINPSSMTGPVTGSTRTLAHGLFQQLLQTVVVAATLPGQALPSNSAGTLQHHPFQYLHQLAISICHSLTGII